MDIKLAFDKGIPVNYKNPVPLSFVELEHVCSINSNIKNQLNKYKRMIREIIKKTYGFNIERLQRLYNHIWIVVLTDENTLEKTLKTKICESIMYEFCYIFNCKQSYIDNVGINCLRVDSTNLDKYINDFVRIKTEEELKLKNKELYDAYDKFKAEYIFKKNQYDFYKEIDDESLKERFLLAFAGDRGLNTTQEALECLTDVNLNYGFLDFKKEIINMYNDFIKISSELDDIDIEINIELSPKDKKRLDLYIAYKYLYEADIVDSNEKQKYMYYLSSYFNLPKEERVRSVSLGSGEKILYDDIYNKYVELLANNPELRIINFEKNDFNGMTLSEISEFMEEYLKDLTMDFSFFKKSELEKVDKEILEKLKNKYAEEKQEGKRIKIENQISKFIEKKKFFDSSDPYYRIVGKDKFDGYLGYIYPNGIVVMEKFFENSEKLIFSKGDAIYVMPFSEFYNITKHSKKEIIENNLCKRYVHKGDWQSRVKKDIESGELDKNLSNMISTSSEDKKIYSYKNS